MNEPRTAGPFLTKPEIAGTIIILILVIIFGRLCLWQVARLRDRRTDNAAIAARLAAPPLDGVAGIADTAGVLHRGVMVRGTFDNARSIILPGRSFMGTPGVHLITPLRLADGTAVLLNRGWVPASDGATVDLTKLVALPRDSIVGIVLPFPGRALSLSPTADSTSPAGSFRRVWYAIDEAALRSQFPYDLANVMIQLTPSTDGFRVPRPLDPPVLEQGPHLSYALQWFSFAIITLVGWITFVLRNRAVRTGAARVVRAPPHPPRL